MSDLPEGWERVRFGDLNSYSSGTVDPSNTPGEEFELYSVPIFPTGEPEFQLGSEIGSTKQSVEPADVLVCKINPRINRVWQVKPKGPKRQIASSEWIVIRSPEMDPRFLRYYFMSPAFREFICQDVTGVGGSLTRAQPKRVATHGVPIAPRPEQGRIADKLDAVLARVDACRARLDRADEIIQRFRQSVLSTATSGNQNAESSASEADSVGWELHTLADLCERGRVITYGVIKLGPEAPSGIPCLRTSNVRWLRFELDGLKKISPSLSLEYSRTILQGGEVLVNVRGTLGGVAVSTPTMMGWNVSREVAVVPVDTLKVNPSYLAYWIGSSRSQQWLGAVKKGVAYIGINIEDLRSLPVMLPTLQEQSRIVALVQTLNLFADVLEARLQSARLTIDALTPALLAKAFRGELVPQDPNDEPAAELLERIRASKTPKKSVPRQKRRSARNTKREAMLTRTPTHRKDPAVRDQPYLKEIVLELGGLTDAAVLFNAAALPIVDFYKQLADEFRAGHLREAGEGQIEAAKR
ncbi:MAG: restriction endonuclease subunit S [Methanoregulaceae archaeon]|nr:restriction endonuclease subunit S [Methanoregulaceae archaeon]